MLNQKTINVDSPIGSNDDLSLIDIFENLYATRADNKLDYKKSLKTEIKKLLGTLIERKKSIICYFNGIGIDQSWSLDDIGSRFSLTKEGGRTNKRQGNHQATINKLLPIFKTLFGLNRFAV